MSWVTVAIAAGTAVMGSQAASRKADQQKSNNIAQSELTRYSPWTGMKGQLDNSYTPSALEGGVSGGIQGVGISQGLGLGKSGWGDKMPGSDPSVTPNMGNGMQNAFGGSDMSSQLGMQGQMFQNGFKPNLYAGK